MKRHSAIEDGRPGSGIYPTSSLGEDIPGIATGRDVEWEPLVDYRRNGVSETTVHGAVAWSQSIVWPNDARPVAYFAQLVSLGSEPP